jgi:hypothetical protein
MRSTTNENRTGTCGGLRHWAGSKKQEDSSRLHLLRASFHPVRIPRTHYAILIGGSVSSRRHVDNINTGK